MKLLCPNCNRPITRDNVNLRTCICYCSSCDEFFKVSEFLSPFQQLSEAEQPRQTRWSVQITDTDYIISRKSAGWSNGNIFLLCVAIFIILFLALGYGEATLFLFILFAIALVLVFNFNLKHQLTINTKELVFIKQVLKFKWIQRKAYGDWDRVRVETEERENEKAYYVRLYFVRSESVTLPEGKDLEEQQWLAKELYRIKDDCALNKAKRYGIMKLYNEETPL
ncbi:hypothetical protein [Desertivirga brevis]|uniref:hypothetical protein n=1 Tax=Desertivirga brevis TaxID=2810310 RepID=UPI001A97B5EA|nr:hypothetical protein [Pedobacter sp. SYSU D00873]